MALPVSDVRRLSIADMVVEVSAPWQRSSSSRRLVFQFAKSGVDRTVRLLYFTPGIRWIPTYRLDLADTGDEAQLSLQGELLNELEDFDQVPITLVVGVPNLRYRSVVSPLTLESELRRALLQAAPQVSGLGGQLSNALFSQRVSG